jgi:hypothetical protein
LGEPEVNPPSSIAVIGINDESILSAEQKKKESEKGIVHPLARLYDPFFGLVAHNHLRANMRFGA